MEMNYIYCVPCHNLLLNKRTVLEKAPVMIRVAARGQCGSAGGGLVAHQRGADTTGGC